MKKFLSFILCGIVIISLVACDVTEPTKNNEQSSKTEFKTNKTEQIYSLNETAEFTDLKFTALDLKESDGDSFFVPQSGNVFVGVKFEIENISDEEQSISSLLQFECYADDVKCEYSLNAACAFDEGTLDGSIAPGKKLVGWYAVEVSSDWSNIEIDVLSNWLSNNPAKFIFAK